LPRELVLRRGSDAQLLHHTQGVEDQPRFGSLLWAGVPLARLGYVLSFA
jgi:hypothetical protein